MTVPALEAHDLRKTYGTGPAATEVLKGVSFTIAPGEVVLLMGPSGSGKTTLLSIIGALLAPSGGSVRLAGHDPATLDQAGRAALRLAALGFVFQGYNLFPTLTAAENIRLALDLRGVRGSPARLQAAALLAEVGLADRADVYPALLSGGQKQRVAIARALAGRPGLLLADEPTASLDWSNGRRVLELMRSLAHAHQTAALIVTHDPRCLDFADRVLRIEDGVLLPDPEP